MRRGSPLPIPNREVKPACADGTAICGRVCRRLFLWKACLKRQAFLFFIGATCSPPRRVGSSPFFSEPQSEKIGVFLLVRRSRKARVVAFFLEKPFTKVRGFLFLIGVAKQDLLTNFDF